MTDYPRNPDDPTDVVVAYLNIAVRKSGAMSVAGSINDERYALALLETAKDTVRAHHRKGKSNATSPLIVPAHDTALQ
jgi:hypothetical protein